LSLTSVSLAAVKASCDFRFEAIHKSDESGQNSVTDNTDFRIIVKEKFNDSVAAYVRMRMTQSHRNNAANEDDIYADLYYLTLKTKWADLKAGYFDHWVHPDRILAYACNSYRFVEKNPGMIEAKIPLLKGFYTQLVYVVDSNADREYTYNKKTKAYELSYLNSPNLNDDAYAIALGYKNLNYGILIHYFDSKMADSYKLMNSAFCFDAFYNFANGNKLFAYGTCPEYKIDTKSAKYEDEVIVGLKIPEFLSSKLSASFEYNVTGRTQYGVKWERDPYAIDLIYTLAKNLTLELQHWNTNKTNDVENLLRFRLRF
jgi:hypothetical protein